ncbi:MAG: lactate racemase domain-containing protein [Acidimicrobiales bacterium]
MKASSPDGAAAVGGPGRFLAGDEVETFIHERLSDVPLDGRSVCMLVPDATRSCPLPLLVRSVYSCLKGRVSRLTVLVALGTHAAMGAQAHARHLGYRPGGLDETFPGMRVVDHACWDPGSLVTLGTIRAAKIADLSNGAISQDVPVRVNRAVVDHEVTLIVGPVFPHEVVGFSGGNKYLFPGVSGHEFIDVSHWLGALITSADIIGVQGITPVRALIDEAASMVPSERWAFCAVNASESNGLHFLAFDEPTAAWQAAAEVSAQTHIRYLDTPVRKVLSILPRKYDDMWTGAKGFYKVEPVVADGGQVVIYAPHVTELAVTHPAVVDIGYHCRDFYVKQWDRFKGYHWGDLAHSTHLRGAGTYSDLDGERARVTVTLATGIPEKVVRSVNLDYLDPSTIDLAAWAGEEGSLVVRGAGEQLYRLSSKVTPG